MISLFALVLFTAELYFIRHKLNNWSDLNGLSLLHIMSVRQSVEWYVDVSWLLECEMQQMFYAYAADKLVDVIS